MSSEPSKYASNQFEVGTVGRNPLMSEILSDTLPRLVLASNLHPGFNAVVLSLNTAAQNWSTGETALANAEATLLSATAGLQDKLASVTRKPDIDTNSLLETWDSTIRAQVPYQGTVYKVLLPHGRETVTAGNIEQQLDALRDFGIRLTAQVAKPALVTLGGVVTTFATAARGLRTTQITGKSTLDVARTNQDTLRIAAASELYNMVGVGMSVFKATPDQVDTLFDVNLLRDPVQSIPLPPTDTAWNPTARTLSTTALPDAATRLEAWREGTGGMPELLAVGDRLATSITIPATITFHPGELYQFWIQSRNAAGSSAAGPKISWTAV